MKEPKLIVKYVQRTVHTGKKNPETSVILATFARNVVLYMNEKKISPTVLALRAGVGEKTVNNLINGRHGPQLRILIKLARALDVEFWKLWMPPFSDGTAEHLTQQISQHQRAIERARNRAQ